MSPRSRMTAILSLSLVSFGSNSQNRNDLKELQSIDYAKLEKTVDWLKKYPNPSYIPAIAAAMDNHIAEENYLLEGCLIDYFERFGRLPRRMPEKLVLQSLKDFVILRDGPFQSAGYGNDFPKRGITLYFYLPQIGNPHAFVNEVRPLVKPKVAALESDSLKRLLNTEPFVPVVAVDRILQYDDYFLLDVSFTFKTAAKIPRSPDSTAQG